MDKKDLNIHQPHDTLFKKAFKDKEVAKDFLKNRLPPEVLARIELNTLKLENSSFVSQELSKSHSDLVLSAYIDGQKGYIYFLVELQMTSDKLMALRLLEYNVLLMREHIDKKKENKLPTIINLVIYAGKASYKGDKRIIDSFKDPQAFTHMGSSEFLIDLSGQSKEEILKDGKAGPVELILKEGQKRDFCKFLEKEESRDIILLINDSSYGKQVVLYMLERDKHNPDEVLNKMHNLDPELKQDIMSGLQRVIQESEQRGIQLGEKRGIQLGEKKGMQLLAETLIKKGYISKADAEKVLKDAKKST